MASPDVRNDVSVSVLGPLTVSTGGGDVDLGGPKARLVLALLLANIDRVVSNDGLIAGLWGEDPPATARKAVQVHISNLRRALGEGFPLRTAPGGYIVQSAGIDIDAVAFETELDTAKAKLRTDPLAAERTISDALARWQGPAYADLQDEPALAAEIARLDELRLQALEGRLDAALRAGRHADVVGELSTLAFEHPFRERFTELHMLALYRSGRQAEALRSYQRTRSTLVDELGLEPGPALQELQRQVLEQSVDLDLDEGSGERFAFLATDIEASTAIWEADPEAMQAAVARHDELLRIAVETNAGTVFKGTGDGIFAVFSDASDCLQAAVDAQLALHDEPWPTGRPILVRMGVDEGVASARGGDYFGPALNRVSRIMSSGHGGQVLCPVELALRSPVGTRHLGSADYKGVGRLDVAQLVIAGLPDEFPDLQTHRAPKAMVREGFGRAIRGYELRERLGEGAHGVVYRAYQASIGREVAVKVIRPEHANQPDFVKRFEAEAQFVAQLEHPHVVSLYDYWRDPDGAYLVMQLLRGGSLSSSLERAPWRPSAALKLLDQVGTALDYAHRQGVVHRDLKPANVLLDGEGNAYLTDFGIASQHLAAVGVPAGSSVAYVSPEELAGAAAGPASDMYGLGLLTYEILTGDRPPLGAQPASVAERRQDLPPSLDQVLARATDPDPGHRFDRVDEFLRMLRQAFGTDVVTHVRRGAPTEIRNPYKGLRAFTETDAQDYYGRDDLVRELLDHVTTQRLTAVVGPSGSGKSSLVRAGLLPEIRRRAASGVSSVLITDMFPGSYPFEELEVALLRVAVDRPDGVLGELVADERGLLRMTKQLLPDDDSELLLVIDQFEELFLLTSDDETRQRFLASLVTVANDERSRVRIVLTMRADHFDRPLSYPDFGALLRDHVVPVSMPTHDELTRAIAQPAAAAGLEFEAGLIPRIVRDVADEPGALPLLQYALTELVANRDGAVLTAAGYEGSGGVTGALTARAEEIFGGLPEVAQKAAPEVFLRLVAVDDAGDDTRRRVRRAELESLGLGEAALDAVLDAYGSFRLLTFDHEPLTRGPTVEVAHEALIREWPRFRGWIDARREDLLLERRLAASTAEWDDGGRDPSFLFAGGQLEQYERWARDADVRLTSSEREFLDESRRASDEATTARRRRRGGVLVALAALAVLATIAAVIASIERQDAQRSERAAEADRATAETARAEAEDARAVAVAASDAASTAREDAVIRRMIADAAALRDRKPTLSMLLAREAFDRRPGPDTLGALLSALQRTDGYAGFIPVVTSIDGGQWVGALDNEHLVVRTGTSIDVYDLDTRSHVSSTPASALALGPFSYGVVGGGRFATVTAARELVMIEQGRTTAEVVDAIGAVSAVGLGADGSMIIGRGTGVSVFLADSPADELVLGTHGDQPVLFAAISPDGSVAATADALGSLTIWDVAEARPTWTWTRLAPDEWIEGAGRIEVGRYAQAEPITLGAIVGGAPPSDPSGSGTPLLGELRFSRDGRTLYANAAGLAAIDVESGALRWVSPSQTQFQFDELPDGRLISNQQVIDDGRVVDTLAGVTPTTRTTATPDGSVIAALSQEGIELWSANGDQLIATAVARNDHNFATLGARGELASFSLSKGVEDADSPARVVSGAGVEIGPLDDPTRVAFTKTGDLVTTYGQSATPGDSIVIRDPDTTDPLGPPLPPVRWASIQTSADRRFVAVGPLTGSTIEIHDLATGELITRLDDGLVESGWGVYYSAFSADGSLFAATNQTTAAVWATDTWELRHVFTPAADDTFTEIAFTPDGSELATSSSRDGLVAFDLDTGERRVIAAGTVVPLGINDVNGLAFDDDETYVVVAGDGANLVDVATGELVGPPFPSSHLTHGASIAPDGRSLVTGTEDHLLVWELDTDRWSTIACHAAGRNMTADEWEQFGWPDEPYHPTCPEWDTAR